jgi:hypothetical protein
MPNIHNTVHDEDNEQPRGTMEDAEAVHHSACCHVLHDLYSLFDEPTPLAIPPIAGNWSDRDERATAVHVQSSPNFRLERRCTVQVDAKLATVHWVYVPRRHPCPEFDGNRTRFD